MKHHVGLTVLCFAASGCVNNLTANRISAESYPNDRAQTSFSRVFAWDSKYSAGIGNSYGLCAQGALTAESSNFGAALDAVSKKVDTQAKGAIQSAKALSALNTTNAQTAFANIGYFYVCQIALNNKSATPESQRLQPEQIVKLFQSVSDTVPKIRSSEGQIASVRAEQLQQFAAYLQSIGENVPDDLAEQIEDAANLSDESSEER